MPSFLTSSSLLFSSNSLSFFCRGSNSDLILLYSSSIFFNNPTFLFKSIFFMFISPISCFILSCSFSRLDFLCSLSFNDSFFTIIAFISTCFFLNSLISPSIFSIFFLFSFSCSLWTLMCSSYSAIFFSSLWCMDCLCSCVTF